MVGKKEDEGLWTVECLRGRLLAERAVSKAAKAEADLMAKRVAELERQLAEEMKSINGAERMLRYALKKLESLKVSDVSSPSNLSESSSSSSGREPSSEIVDSGQCGSGGEMRRLPDSVDFIGDDGSGDSSADSPIPEVSQDGSWSSVGTDYPPRINEAEKSIGPHDSITDAARQHSASGNKPVSMKQQPEHRDDTREAVPASLRRSSAAYTREISSGVRGALFTQDSLGRSAVCSHKGLCGV